MPPFETEADARAYAAKSSGSDGYVSFAIVEGDRVLGGVAAQLNRRMRTAWISYWLLPEARGRGLASAGAVGLSEWLFAEQNMHRIELGHRLANPDSRKVADRAGFIQEGIMREELEYDGVRYDTALMSRLVSDPRPSVEALPGLQ